jgi:segregation and condensation protein A
VTATAAPRSVTPEALPEPPTTALGAGPAFVVQLDAFSGPLDLLLHLLREEQLEIADIPIARIADQFLQAIGELGLNQAADYLDMASRLVRLKAQMLLPRGSEEDGWEDPRAELVRRLLEYEQIKLAAARLDALPVLGRDFLRAQVTIEQSLEPRFPDVEVDELREAWLDILKRAKLNQHHKITREQLSVREHMSIVLRTLQGRRFVEFDDLFDVTRGAQVMVVTFIALLELARERLLEITQAEAFAPLYVRLACAPA